ncbi:hypothetical protein MDOR_02990 [Mycolicibacterium doricum]|uniref:Glycoside hydrolase family 65 central catalytic domain-containing protein n=1 Tax=Mycolicibacterium doricum TaxID=126673 RepID=A0A7I7VM54_9MYCO|nr:hypothetical protein MDOR_02990 [Mycolicibacterium doricum]
MILRAVEELQRWDHVSRRMFVPFHDGLINQFEGYEQLAELDWESYRTRYGNIQRLDRILQAEGDDGGLLHGPQLARLDAQCRRAFLGARSRQPRPGDGVLP